MGHYFTNEDELKSNEKTISINVLDSKFKFLTDNGVFSKDFLDYGTKVLIETVVKESDLDGNILDVGCGYGALGLVIASQTEHVVTMVDVNQRALALCQRNSELNNITNVKIFESNIYENVNETFQTILSNPPIRAGKRVVHQIIKEAYDYLIEGGCLYFVMKKQHGAKSAIKALDPIFSEVKVVKKDSGYFIIKCKK